MKKNAPQSAHALTQGLKEMKAWHIEDQKRIRALEDKVEHWKGITLNLADKLKICDNKIEALVQALSNTVESHEA